MMSNVFHYLYTTSDECDYSKPQSKHIKTTVTNVIHKSVEGHELKISQLAKNLAIFARHLFSFLQTSQQQAETS